MKAIILAAGIGSRLNSLTKNKPKALIKVLGKPILSYQIEAFKKAGLSYSDILIVTGYLGEKIEEFCKSKYSNIRIVQNSDYLSTNNMYSLYLALNSLKKGNVIDEDVIITNGDCIYDENIVNDIIKTDKSNLIACDSKIFLEESMKIKIDNKTNNVVEISKQISSEESYATSIDLYKFSKKEVSKLYEIINENYIKKGILNKWTEFAINDLFKVASIVPFDIKGRKWAEIDNLQDLLDAEKNFSSLNVKNKKAIIVDLDGTIYLGNNIFIDAIEFINKNWKTFDFYFLTNNTSQNIEDYVSKLREIGIKNINKKNIITPIIPLKQYLKEKNIKNVYCISTKSFQKELENSDIKCKEEDVDAVIVAFDKELTYSKLEKASYLLQSKDVKFLSTHPDLVCPTEKGNIPDAGAISNLLENVTKRKLDYIFGKPNRAILDHLLEVYDIKDLVFIGDRLYTDKLLAENIGMDFILVLTGETTREEVESEEKFPALILRRLSELEEII